MTKKIQCEAKKEARRPIKVRLIKAPFVDTNILRSVIADRARAVIL